MRNILIAAFGVFLIIIGFYAMSFGFSTPPNIAFFFLGLIITVFGGIAIIIYGSQIDFNDYKGVSKGTSRKSNDARSVMKPHKLSELPKKQISSNKPAFKDLSTKDNGNEKTEIPSKVNISQTQTKTVPAKKSPLEVSEPKSIMPRKIVENDEAKDPLKEADETGKAKIMPPKIKPVPQETDKIKTEGSMEKVTSKTIPQKQNKIRFPFKRIKTSPAKIRKSPEEETYIKNRLNKLKDDTLKSSSDIEILIEDRLDAFKGTVNQIKSDSNDPGIIWSFDAKDVQKTMQDTILKADEKLLIMYPWIRNIEVSALKKFIETDSRMILQEASLDDDASVELMRLLMDNNVKIRTMPHVHTVAVVADKNNGLIISTDPIYESFDVGVIYNDEESIEEIEKMFEEAWKLSQDINLNLG